MPVQVQEIVERIRREGLEAAKEEADALLASAKEDARRMRAEAETEAAALVAEARAAAKAEEEAGRAALSQAARDLLLEVRGAVSSVLDSLLRADCSAALSPEALSQAIPRVLEGLGREEGLAVLLGGEAEAFDRAWIAALKERLAPGVEVLPSAGPVGFRVQERNGASYYDFSAESLAECLASRLGPRLAELMRAAGKGA